MKLFSLDCSTTNASIALFDGSEIVDQASWSEPRARHEGLFEVAADLMKKNRWLWAEIGLFAVGRGPGAYSGLRVSLLAAQALAAPADIPVMAVSSMDALALAIMTENDLERITLVGDARRQTFWFGRCVRATLGARAADWSAVGIDQAVEVLKDSSVIATPHWDAMAGIRNSTPESRWLNGPVIPTAIHVARLALLRRGETPDSEPLTPLYMHPAV